MRSCLLLAKRLSRRHEDNEEIEDGDAVFCYAILADCTRMDKLCSFFALYISAIDIVIPVVVLLKLLTTKMLTSAIMKHATRMMDTKCLGKKSCTHGERNQTGKKVAVTVSTTATATGNRRNT